MTKADGPIFEARGLTIRVAGSGGAPGREIVKDVSFIVPPGRVVALIGESGSGKTTIALSTLGYTRPGLEFGGGAALFDGKDLIGLSKPELTRLRGLDVAYVAQSAAAAFNPSIPVGEQVIESAVLKGKFAPDAAKARARALFDALELPEPATIGNRYPHQVSGGQLQRLMLAMALCTRPRLLVLDEPTTALDVTTQIEVLKSLKTAIAQEGVAAVYVSHDLAVVSQIADDVLVLYDGKVMEKGPVETLIAAPQHPYTRRLIAAMPKLEAAPPSDAAATPDDVLLRAKGITAGYGRSLMVLQDVDLTVRRGHVVGVIGESGSGKSTLARVIAGLLAPASGQAVLDGQPLAPTLRQRPRETLRKIQFVFQMADTALNPNQTVAEIVGRPLRFYHRLRGRARRERTLEILGRVDLAPNLADRYPAELSGGQKQRVNLARALAADPEVLICDEVTSALDTVVAANIMRLLDGLRRNLGVSFVFISHDLSTVATFADEIVVLYGGRVVESGPVSDVLAPPFHPYTRLLTASAPEMRPGWLEEVTALPTVRAAEGRSVTVGAPGCPFFPRCPVAIPGTCDVALPPTRTGPRTAAHVIVCHRSVEWLARTSDESKLARDRSAADGVVT